MPYVKPKTRDCSVLSGQPFYAKKGSPLDLEQFTKTAVPAGSRGRLIANGEFLAEADNPNVPIRLVGNNTGFNPADPIDKVKMDQIIAKYRASGINFIRLHHLEAYLFYKGNPYESGKGCTSGARNYVPERLDEVQYLLYRLEQAGIYYCIGLASSNLTLNLSGRDRWDRYPNTEGTATAVVTNGVVTAINLVTPNTTKYHYPPSVIITQKDKTHGTGARAIANIDANGILTGFTIIDGGSNYKTTAGVDAPPDVAMYGGTGNGLMRVRLGDENMKANWIASITDLLTMYNPYTGQQVKDSKALAFVECMNEAHIRQYLDPGAGLEQMRPKWQKWLSDRYGTIAALNTKWSTGFISFNDTALYPLHISEEWMAGNGSKRQYAETRQWMHYEDITFYDWCKTAIRAAGWTGMITTRDMASNETAIGKIHYQTSDIQTYHSYSALIDVVTPGGILQNGGGNHNSPAYLGMAMNRCLGAVMKNKPRFWTEAGYPVPARYRGEFGLLYGAYSSMYNFAGIDIHADCFYGTHFGADFNGYRAKSLYPHRWQHDPLTNASVFLMNIMFHRGDVTTPPIDREFVYNDKSMSLYKTAADLPTSPAAFVYNKAQAVFPNQILYLNGVARIETSWDETDSQTVANTWLTEFTKSLPDQLISSGFNSSHESYDWVNVRGNDNVDVTLAPKMVMYTKNREIFNDGLAGVFGVNTPRTQAGVIFKPFTLAGGTLTRYGSTYKETPDRNQPVVPSNAFKLNYMGNRFWNNLEINYVEDGVLLGVTSGTMNPISTTDSMIIVAASTFYNTGASFTNYNSTITSIPVTNGGSGYTKAPYIQITSTDRKGVGAIAIGILDAGVLVGVQVLEGGTGYNTGAVTATVVRATGDTTGSGAVLGTPVLSLDDPSREIVIEQSFPNDGKEGWPIQQKSHVVDFNIVGIDNTALWVLNELDFHGNVLGSYPVFKVPNGVRIRIDSMKTVQPSVYFQLKKVAATSIPGRARFYRKGVHKV